MARLESYKAFVGKEGWKRKGFDLIYDYNGNGLVAGNVAQLRKGWNTNSVKVKSSNQASYCNLLKNSTESHNEEPTLNNLFPNYGLLYYKDYVLVSV